MNTPIDAVITWVDGDDPALNAKRHRFSSPSPEMERRDDIAASTRYASLGEIYWCLRSIQRNAPFIRKIFIVTDGQDPEVKKHIPDFNIPVEIIDHKVIFRGYEDYLPVFNSLAIETMLWRIPGLSENFIYLNDDFFIMHPVAASDWFDSNGLPVIYGSMYPVWEAKISRRLNWLVKGKKVVKFRDTMLQAALLPGIDSSNFIRIQHLPLSMKKNLFEVYFAEHPEAVIQNIRHRFRDISQYNPQELNYILAWRKYGLTPIPASQILVTMGPSGEHRFMRRFRKLTTSPDIKFLCINSMDQMTESQRALLSDYLECIL